MTDTGIMHLGHDGFLAAAKRMSDRLRRRESRNPWQAVKREDPAIRRQIDHLIEKL